MLLPLKIFEYYTVNLLIEASGVFTTRLFL